MNFGEKTEEGVPCNRVQMNTENSTPAVELIGRTCH
jgi:hypothetical protein